MNSDSDSDSEGSNDLSSHSDNYSAYTTEGEFEAKLPRIRENDPLMTTLTVDADFESVQNMDDEEWEQFGRDIANNTHLDYLCFIDYGALNDHKISRLFRGLTRSRSITHLILQSTHPLSVAAVRSMVPFLQNANSLRMLHLADNKIQSEGFNLLFRELRDGPIETLHCSSCGIESIDIEHIPKHLTRLGFQNNNISADGCRVLAKLLQRDATLKHLHLNGNKIDDEGVEILVNALQNNTALKTLDLRGNNEISNQGRMMLLKLVNDISSIKATLQSNHTLEDLKLMDEEEENQQTQQVQRHIDRATAINDVQEDAGRMKVLQFQLHSERRAELAGLQGVTSSLYSEIDPLHLPEVLALVGRHHGQGEFFVALKSSIAGVISTVNREQCLKQQRGYHNAMIAEHMAKLEAIDAELAVIEAVKGRDLHVGSEHRSNKTHRVS